ncbi:MAG: hypothetical protein GYB15_01440 [Gammaproteobacteria bacterium]|nr:hypothetical protein [Gammaproteobacteria bacterium]
MSLKKFVVNIEGDYVDSYIYSGYLVLVDSEYRLTVYKWAELFELSSLGVDSLQFNTLKALLDDSRKPIPKNNKTEVVITREMLERSKRCTFNIGVWPTDINIFSNKVYISSENGLIKLDLDFNSGELQNKKKLFDEICFSVSPNSHNRLAFAAGKEGVLTLIPTTKFYNSNDVKQLISGTCLDIDWQSTKLLANTVNGVVETVFIKMPERSEFNSDNEYFSAVKKCKRAEPEIYEVKNAKFSWMAGDKKYTLDHDFSIIIDVDEKEIKSNVNFKSNILRARTAAFGTIFETQNSLFGLIGDNEVELAKDPVSWRVFPRAKNYANQLHIVNEDHVAITIIESSRNNDFGFDPENIDLVG